MLEYHVWYAHDDDWFFGIVHKKKKMKCNVNEFVHWNYNDAQIRMITYLCHDLEIDVKGFSLVDNDKGGDS